MDTKEYFFLRCLLDIDGVGPTRIRNLLAEFNSFENIFKAPLADLVRVELLSTEIAKRILRQKTEFERISKIMEKEKTLFDSLNARVISYWDEDYPFLLKKIYDPPLLLYAMGDMAALAQPTVAIIGTRLPTAYGKQLTEKITLGLVESGVTIVSGFARGIDTVAHLAVLKQDGMTVAVLGSGLDVMYPNENKKHVPQLIKKGVLLSEYPFGTKPDAGNFPRRNRIISGLSRAVVVMETKMTGGAMITAKLALDQGRDVFALPGNAGVFQAEGTNFLIKTSSAKLITSAADILEDLGIASSSGSARAKKPEADLSQLTLFEAKIYQTLTDQPQQLDVLSASSGIAVSDCLVHLLSLEFKNLVRQMPGKMFVRE